MPKTTLIERMEKAGAPKVWVVEVKRLQRELKEVIDVRDMYLDIIDILARRVEEEEAALEQFESTVD